jgi:hypothetical protein
LQIPATQQAENASGFNVPEAFSAFAGFVSGLRPGAAVRVRPVVMLSSDIIQTNQGIPCRAGAP